MASDEELARFLRVHFQLLMFQFCNRAHCSYREHVILFHISAICQQKKKPHSWLFWQSFCLYDFLEYILMTGILQIFATTITCFINAVKWWRKIRGANDIQSFRSVRAPHSYSSSRYSYACISFTSLMKLCIAVGAINCTLKQLFSALHACL